MFYTDEDYAALYNEPHTAEPVISGEAALGWLAVLIIFAVAFL